MIRALELSRIPWSAAWPRGRHRQPADVQPWVERSAWAALQVGAELHQLEGAYSSQPSGCPSSAFLAAQEGLGLPWMSVHGTRHTHITTLLRAKVPVHIVSRRAGHRDTTTTQNIYADVLAQDDADAAAVFEQALYG